MPGMNGKADIHGYCTIRVELDGAGQPIDWTFIHANEELAKIEGKKLDELIGHRFFEVFPDGDRKWLNLCYDAAYNEKSVSFDDISEEHGVYRHVEAYPIGKSGCCACFICDIKENVLTRLRQQEEQEALLKEQEALLEAYEEEKKRNAQIRHYTEALGIVYPLVISIDYTNDYYTMFEYDNFLNKTTPYSGTIKELVLDGASTIPDSGAAEAFVSLFNKEATVDAFRHGKKELTLRHPQNGDDGKVHYMETRIICTECSDDKVTAICMAKCIDEEAEREHIMHQAAEHAAVISALSTIYITIIEADLVNHGFKIIQTTSPFKAVAGGRSQGNFNDVMEDVLDFYMHPDDIDRMRDFIDLSTVSARLGADTTLVTEYRAPYGKWFESRFIAKERDEQGHVISAIYAARDVTPEKEKELHYREQLKEQLTVLDALSRNFKNAFLIDIQAGTAKILKLEDEHTGHRLDDVLNTEFIYVPFLKGWIRDVVHPDDQAALMDSLSIANLQKVFAKQTEYTGNYRRMVGERYLNYQFTALLTQDGLHLIVGFQNVDSIIRAHLEEEKKQREKEQAYQNQLREQLMISNTLARSFKNAYLLDLEKETAKILKLEANCIDFDYEETKREFPFDTVLAHWINNIVCPEDRAEISKVFTVENVKKQFSIENELTGNYRSTAGGQTHYYQYRMSRATETKAILGFQNVDDIILAQLEEEKKRRELEQAYQNQLKTVAEEAEKANKAKTEFLMRMSHDIRTPLNGIRGMLDMADFYGSDLEKVKECRRKVRESSNILLELINEVLDMSKLESGEVVLEHVPFDLKKISFEIFTVVEKMAEEQNVRILENQNIQHVRFIGSPIHYKRLIMNILSNAIKYNRPNGKVYVTCREVSFDGKTVVLESVIRDTGIGMSEEFQKHLFEPFQQENASVRSKYGGSGLGLSIAKSLTDKMGGTITCESKKDVGTTFTVRVPFEVDFSEHIDKTPDSGEDASIAGETVILAEDNEINLEIAQFMLSKSGVDVIVAHNGEEAVKAFNASKPGEVAAILMDLMMPVMDGYEATRCIRAMDRKDAGTIPIIAMTANAFVEDRIATKKAGMNAHIAKPLETRTVVRIIAEQLKAARDAEMLQ